jgi:hypothetical protein
LAEPGDGIRVDIASAAASIATITAPWNDTVARQGEAIIRILRCEALSSYTFPSPKGCKIKVP